MKCSKCGSRDIDFQESTGQSICISCGTVLEESTIVSSIEFQESGDRSHVIGQYVAANCTKPYISGSRMMNRHAESRDTALINARRVITQLASSLRLPPIYVDRAYRLFQLALQRNLIFGRRQTHLVATCLYIICRQEKSPFLLIDFSDILQINVYVLGRAFLQFANVLNISLPIVDPSLYIHRYASQFDFNDRQSSVVTSSLRIVTRLKKDWIVTGRRPDGVCAAALLIAARAHGFNISHETVASLFRIANETVRRRLLEFKQTPSAQLNLAEFHHVDATIEYDPPSFIRNVLADHEDVDVALEEDVGAPALDAKDLAQDEVYTHAPAIEEDEDEEEDLAFSSMEDSKRTISTTLGGRTVKVPFPEPMVRRKPSKSKLAERLALYDSIYAEVFESSSTQQQRQILRKEADELEGHPEKLGGWGSANRAKAKVIDNKLTLTVALGQKDRRGGSASAEPAGAETAVNDEAEIVNPLSDSESANYIFTEEERLKRTLIWDKTFGSFMEERARRKREREKISEDAGGDKYTETGKLRKKYSKKAAKGATASEAVLTSSRGSKNINYDALKGMFGNDGAFAIPADEGAARDDTPMPPPRSILKTKDARDSEHVSRAASKTVSIGKPSEPKAAAVSAKPAPAPEQPAAAAAAPAEDLYEDEDEDMLLYEGDGDQDDYDDEYY